MQPERRERLRKMAAQVALEYEPEKFQALLLELQQMLQTDKNPPFEIVESQSVNRRRNEKL